MSIQLLVANLEDGTKELHDMGEGVYRVSVFQEGPNGTEWDWEEFDGREDAQGVFDTLKRYEDLEDFCKP